MQIQNTIYIFVTSKCMKESQQIWHVPCIDHRRVLAEHSHQQSEQFYLEYIYHSKYPHSSYSDAVKSIGGYNISNQAHET